METGYDIMRAMTQTFPVPLGDLWVEPDDTHAGVRVLTKDESEATERVLTRPDKSGSRTPYYAYRDAAMSRLGPFRPEWIKELRVVEDSNPENPDVVYNNGPSNMCLYLTEKCDFDVRFLSNSSDKWQGRVLSNWRLNLTE